ncbi:hypothetical protein [Pseudonocardia sp. WMMC193]|nr:hypothetical protein [Pseudonocardia sp. WMMC193]MCF7548926.1 hypothetical protein [Pseudonocardia sp. WMMC193]
MTTIERVRRGADTALIRFVILGEKARVPAAALAAVALIGEAVGWWVIP